jgi:hypothetical protein
MAHSLDDSDEGRLKLRKMITDILELANQLDESSRKTDTGATEQQQQQE